MYPWSTSELGSVPIRCIGHPALITEDPAENVGAYIVTSDALPVRYTFDRSETFHKLVTAGVYEFVEGEKCRCTGGMSRSVGDHHGDRVPDYESKAGECTAPEDTTYHMTAKIMTPNGAVYFVTATVCCDGCTDAACEPGHEDPRNCTLQTI